MTNLALGRNFLAGVGMLDCLNHKTTLFPTEIMSFSTQPFQLLL